MEAALRAGAAIYNAGYAHAAHDAWEDRWLACEDGTDDEQLLHGLIQLTAAVYHASERNWSGAVGLAQSASEYLRSPPRDYRGVQLAPLRSYLTALATDPELIERREPVPITIDGHQPTLTDLDWESTAIAAPLVANADGLDPDPVLRARAYAEADLEQGAEDSEFVGLLFAFVQADDDRAIVSRRLTQHVERRATREADVEGLF